uniref:Uncharacterized protein n=1 Tax=Spironucleus salmonicida TaxID=348837 RepID=V6LXE2_9EUKA|eukprot:EST48918.1 Hypothetical protein SS50377_10843 [Spironucleus salmonicida]
MLSGRQAIPRKLKNTSKLTVQRRENIGMKGKSWSPIISSCASGYNLGPQGVHHSDLICDLVRKQGSLGEHGDDVLLDGRLGALDDPADLLRALEDDEGGDVGDPEALGDALGVVLLPVDHDVDDLDGGERGHDLLQQGQRVGAVAAPVGVHDGDAEVLVGLEGGHGGGDGARYQSEVSYCAQFMRVER